MKSKKYGLGPIYARYIFPLLSDLILLITFFIPCLTFVLDSKARESISAYQLMGNAWTESRKYLFSADTKQTGDGKLFYQIVFISLIIVVLLFAVSIAVKIFSICAAYPTFGGAEPNDAQKRRKQLYVTLIPNRAVLIILNLLSLPIAFFPELVTYYYRKILLYSMNLSYKFLPPAVFACVFILVSIVLIAISKKRETRLEVDIFKKKKINITYYEDEPEETEADDDSDERKLYRMKKASAAEQEERLRKLFKNDDN